MKKAKARIGYVIIRETGDQIGPVHFSRNAAREYRQSFGRAVRLAKVRISEVE